MTTKLATQLQNPVEQMITQQIRTWEVFDDDVLSVMQNIRRELFMPEHLKNFAYTDNTFKVSDSCLLPPPSVQGKILQALELHTDSEILQLGAGTGYLSACLAELGGQLKVIDANQELLDSISANCSQLMINNIKTHQLAPLASIESIEGQFDAIIMQHYLTTIPKSIKTALKVEGIAILFLEKDDIISCNRIERIAEDDWHIDSLFEFTVSPYIIDNTVKESFDF